MFRHQGAVLQYLLYLRSFVVIKLPEDGTLVPKQMEVST